MVSAALRIVVATELVILVAQQAGTTIFLAETIEKSRERGLTRRAAISSALWAAYFGLAFVVYGLLITSALAHVVVAIPLTILLWWKVPALIRVVRGDLLRPIRKWSAPDIMFRLTFVTVGIIPLMLALSTRSAAEAGKFLLEGGLFASIVLAAIRIQSPIRRLPPRDRERIMAGEDPEEQLEQRKT
jgi:hypothetical protein